MTSLVRSLHPISAIQFEDGLGREPKAITVRCNLACNALQQKLMSADINHHLFSAVACVKACYVYEHATWLLGPLHISASPYQGEQEQA